MDKSRNRFVLVEARWYAWQMIPGYVGERSIPYCSPIYVTGVKPLHTGKSILRLNFFNVFYAEGVQDFTLDLRILKRSSDYLVSEIIYKGVKDIDRCAVVSHIEFGWIERYCPELWRNYPPTKLGSAEQSSVSLYLASIFCPDPRK